MNVRKTKKVLSVAVLLLLLVQLPWYLVVQQIVNKTQTKTTATVIRIESKKTICTGDRSNRLDPTCDRSPREYPIYEYFDESGNRLEQNDEFFGEYKQNNPLRVLFWREVGDTVPAYYTKDKPEEVVFMAGPLAYTAWLIPLYLALPVSMGYLSLAAYDRFRSRG